MNISRAIPNPNVNVSNSRTVTGPAAGSVSSRGPSIRRSTRRFASSGSSRSTGSSSSSRPSRTRASVAAAVIGFVVDAIRNSDRRSTGAPPIASVPSASTCTSSPCATSATSPGTLSSPTCEAATSANRSSPPSSSSCPMLAPSPPYRRRHLQDSPEATDSSAVPASGPDFPVPAGRPAAGRDPGQLERSTRASHSARRARRSSGCSWGRACPASSTTASEACG